MPRDRIVRHSETHVFVPSLFELLREKPCIAHSGTTKVSSWCRGISYRIRIEVNSWFHVISDTNRNINTEVRWSNDEKRCFRKDKTNTLVSGLPWIRMGPATQKNCWKKSKECHTSRVGSTISKFVLWGREREYKGRGSNLVR